MGINIYHKGFLCNGLFQTFIALVIANSENIKATVEQNGASISFKQGFACIQKFVPEHLCLCYMQIMCAQN